MATAALFAHGMRASLILRSSVTVALVASLRQQRLARRISVSPPVHDNLRYNGINATSLRSFGITRFYSTTLLMKTNINDPDGDDHDEFQSPTEATAAASTASVDKENLPVGIFIDLDNVAPKTFRREDAKGFVGPLKRFAN